MERLWINMLICSVIMSSISLVYIALSKMLRKIWSAKWRYYSWLFILLGFFTPIKPSFAVAYRVEINAVGNPSPAVRDNFLTLGAAVWLLGALMVIIVAMFRQRRFVHTVERLAQPCLTGETELAIKQARELKIRKIRILRIPIITSPMMFGFRYPTVLLPQKPYPPEQLRLVLRHELTHFKRKDLWFKLLLTALLALHWFNPIVYYIVRHIESECELSCDEAVMKNADIKSKKLYCTSILDTISNSKQRKLKPVCASNFACGKLQLKARLQSVFNAGRGKRLALICIIVAVITALSGNLAYAAYSKDSRIQAEGTAISETVESTTVNWNLVEAYPSDEPAQESETDGYTTTVEYFDETEVYNTTVTQP